MDRQTARRSRALVTEKPSAVARTRSAVTRLAVLIFLIAVICAVVVIATGKA